VSTEIIVPEKQLQKNQPRRFFAYSYEEITTVWEEVANEASIPELFAFKDYFVICIIERITEAVIIAASFIREFGALLHHTFYDAEDMVLYLDMREVITKSNYTINDCIDMLDRLYKQNCFALVCNDRWGQKLLSPGIVGSTY